MGQCCFIHYVAKSMRTPGIEHPISKPWAVLLNCATITYNYNSLLFSGKALQKILEHAETTFEIISAYKDILDDEVCGSSLEKTHICV